MIIIKHRINSVEALKSVSHEFGVEIDIRDRNGKLILSHEPFGNGELLEDFLKNYRHKFIVFNVKCEGIEKEITRLAEKYNIKDYFLLDVSFPFMVGLSGNGLTKLAVRFSEFESIETCKNMAGKAEWVWVDCFSKMPLDKESCKILSKNFKICIVSPELVGRPQDVDKYVKKLKGFKIDAVCTKMSEKWTK